MAAADPNIPTQAQLVSDWLKYTIQDFKKSIRKRGISNVRDNLLNSIDGIISSSSADVVSKVVIKFLLHGRYVDMGVGRGVPIGSQAAKADFFRFRNKKGQLHKYGRKPKQWYSRTYPGKEKDLLRLLNENFGIKTLQVLESSLKAEINITI